MDVDVDVLVVVSVFQLAGLGTVVVMFAETSANQVFPPRRL